MRLKTFLVLALVGFMTSPSLAATKKKKTAKPTKKQTVQTTPNSTPEATDSSAVVPPSPPGQTYTSSEPMTAKRPGVYNEAEVLHLDGTIMVHHADNTVSALQTGSTVEKGDALTVYDGRSWVILRTHKDDKIGLDSKTNVVVDQYYIEGPDRQIHLTLQQGTLNLKTNDSNSKQSFFEIQAGDLVASIGDFRGILSYNPENGEFKAQYLSGKLKVLDKEGETPINVEGSEYLWTNGKRMQTAPVLMDEYVAVNYNRYFQSEDPLQRAFNNILLDHSTSDARKGNTPLLLKGNKHLQEVKDLFEGGKEAYNKRDFKAAKGFWEQALKLEPGYQSAFSRLEALGKEHPELKIDMEQWKEMAARPGMKEDEKK